MNCIEARRMVTPFVNKELTDKETERFLKHIESCSDCMDELDIYYTVYRALDSLDSGAHHEFDFKKMLENDIRMARHAILRRKAVRAARVLLMFLAEVLLLISVLTGYEMKQGAVSHSTFQRAIHRLHAQPLENLPDSEAMSENVQERQKLETIVDEMQNNTEEEDKLQKMQVQESVNDEIQKQSMEADRF